MRFLLSLLLFTYVFSQDGFDEGFDEGFDSDIEITTKKQEPVKEQSPLSIDKTISIYSSYNYSHDKVIHNDFSGFSSLKSKIDVDVEYKLQDYKFKANMKLPLETIYILKPNSYPIALEDNTSMINKLYIQGKISSDIDFKIGRQIVSWGKSDYIKISDIINPTDKRTIGLGDVKDSKLGTTMGKIDYFINEYTLSAILIMENRASILPQRGSDFAPQTKPKNMQRPHNKPRNTIENMGVAFSILGEYNSKDLALYYANMLMDGHQSKSNMLALAYNIAVSKFLLKSEIAYFDYKKDTINALLGIDYNLKNGILGIEVANKNDHILYTGRFSKKYLHDTLDLSLVYVGFGESIGENGIIKSTIDYKINDNMSINAGVVEYLGESIPQFIMIKDNDRVFASIKYSPETTRQTPISKVLNWMK